MEQKRSLETLIGFLTLCACGFFLWFGFQKTSPKIGRTFYPLSAIFSSVEGLEKDAPVYMAGVHIGHVTKIQLHPKTLMAHIALQVQKKILIPKDSSASITSQSLLGNKILTISPGIASENLHAGEAITKTQGALNLEKMIGKFALGMNQGQK